MSDKPSYLGLLNALALGECAAHAYLNEWIAVTEHDGVRATLRTVAAREGEHGLAFAKRIDELGYCVRPKDDPRHAERMEIARSTTMTDLEKMKALGLGRGGDNDADNPDFFARFFFDHTIDIQTGELLGRYICEERDSGRRLRACYEQLVAESGGRLPSTDGSAVDARLTALDVKVDAICAVVTELRDVVCAQADDASSDNGAKTTGSKSASTKTG